MFIISYLEGSAHDWLKPYMEQDLEPTTPVAWLHDVAQFWTEFHRRFSEVNKVDHYRVKLRKQSQTKNVQDYLREFQTYSAPLRYNTTVLRDMFYDGLKDAMKDAMLAQNFDPHNSTLVELTDRALLIDARLEAYTPSRSSTTAQVTMTKTTSTYTAPASSNTPSSCGTQERFNKGDPVYMLGPDNKAKKGVITAIGKNNRGFVTPTVKWNDVAEPVNIPFSVLKHDTRPASADAVPKADPKGPGPMDLDSANKGKTVRTCNICGGKGHFAKVCPSRATSGYEATNEEVAEEIESGKEDA
jgi:hypothetical protein